jgi:glycosyltransferase involved in cell wall biosynthesis
VTTETEIAREPARPFRGPGTTGISRVVLAGIEHSRLGGVSGFMNTMAHGFLGRGYDVEIIGMTPTTPDAVVDFDRDPRITLRTIYDSQPPEWEKLAPLDRLSPAKAARQRRRQSLRAAAISRLRPIVAAWDAETLVICTQLYAMEHLAPAGLVGGRAEGPYIIAQYHGSRDMAVQLGSTGRLREWYADADRFLALTAADGELFREREQLNNTGSVPNPIPAPRHDPAPRLNEVVSLNRYDEQKSLDWLLRAWAVLAPDFPQWRLRLYGEGPLRADLAGLISELGIGGSATLEGITHDGEAALRRGKIYALTSQYEGLPLTIAEAAQAGVPSVAFDCAPGIRELIDDGVDGVVVPPNHLLGLIESLRQLMGDDALRERMGERAQEKAGRFALDAILDQWEEEMGLLTGRRTFRPRQA